MPDITMSLEDTLELDAIIQKWNDPNNIVSDDDNNFNMSGFQTNTRVLEPQNAGTYNITVNGQTLTVEVIDPSNIPDSAIDYFVDGELSEYNTISGTPKIQSTIVKQGSNCLKLEGTRGCVASTSGLDNYPSQGDVVRCWVRTSTADSISFMRGCPDTTSGIRGDLAKGYDLMVNTNKNQISINKHTGGSRDGLVSSGTSTSLSKNTWYEIESKYSTSNELSFELFDKNGNSTKGPITVTDNKFSSSNGIAWVSNNGYGFIDGARII